MSDTAATSAIKHRRAWTTPSATYMPCGGDESQTCGGDRRINIYGAVDTPEHAWLGCRTNTDPGGQVLDGHSVVSASMTNEVCESECEVLGPFDYCGTEASDTPF